MKPVSTVFQTPGVPLQPFEGPTSKPGLASLTNQRTGLDASKVGWMECMASAVRPPGNLPGSHGTRVIEGHRLPANHSMNMPGGNSTGNRGKEGLCDCAHEVDYKTPGMGCSCHPRGGFSFQGADSSGKRPLVPPVPLGPVCFWPLDPRKLLAHFYHGSGGADQPDKPTPEDYPIWDFPLSDPPPKPGTVAHKVPPPPPPPGIYSLSMTVVAVTW